MKTIVYLFTVFTHRRTFQETFLSLQITYIHQPAGGATQQLTTGLSTP